MANGQGDFRESAIRRHNIFTCATIITFIILCPLTIYILFSITPGGPLSGLNIRTPISMSPIPPTPTKRLADVCEPQSGWMPYAVQPGDTLFSIAQKFDTTVEQIQSMNCFSATTIYTEQIIYVPNAIDTDHDGLADESEEILRDVEVTDINIVTENTKYGEIELSFPLRVSAKSSNIAHISVYRPAIIASTDPTTFMVVEIYTDTINQIPPILGELFSEKKTILLDEKMRAELIAPAFEVETLFPAIQAVDIENIGNPTRWAWSIIAPEIEGVHVLNFSIFIDEESNSPSWFRAYQIEVIPPTPIPSATFIPSPTLTTLQKIEENLISDSTKLILQFTTIIGSISAGVYGIIRAHLKRQDEIGEMKKKLESAPKKELEELRDKITKLESIRWWQFWK